MNTQTTRKINDQTRFVIKRDEWRPDGMECEHPLCETIHKNWHDLRTGWCKKPAGKRVEYVIIDTQTDDRPNECCDGYPLKREAVAALILFLTRMPDAEWQQIVKNAGA